MSFAIFRVERLKNSNSIKACELHNERKFKNSSNLDIQKDQSHLNYDLVSSRDYLKDIEKNIKEKRLSEKTVRKDAIKACEVIITSDRMFFDSIGEEKTKEYFQESLEFLKNEFGKDNIIAAKVHLDEETPHLHAIFTPLKDGKLSAKTVLGDREEFQSRQSQFHAHISQNFDLERGKASEMTLTRHKTIKELKIENTKEFLEIDKLVKEKKKELQNIEEFLEWKKENPKSLTKTAREYNENAIKLHQAYYDNSIKFENKIGCHVDFELLADDENVISAIKNSKIFVSNDLTKQKEMLQKKASELFEKVTQERKLRILAQQEKQRKLNLSESMEIDLDW